MKITRHGYIVVNGQNHVEEKEALEHAVNVSADSGAIVTVDFSTLAWEVDATDFATAAPPSPPPARSIYSVFAPNIPPATIHVTPDGDDNGTGSVTAPLATITKAASRATPGDVILVHDGAYRQTITTNVSGTADEPIWFVSETPHGARFDATARNNWWVHQGDHVRIVGFDATHSKYIGIWSRGNHVHLIGNHIHDLVPPDCNGGNGGAGLDHGDYASVGNRTIANIVSGLIPPPPFCNLIHGIYQGTPDSVVQHNVIFDVVARGIETWHGATAENISNNLVWGADNGILIAGDMSPASDYVVSRNVVTRCRLGIREWNNIGQNNVYDGNWSAGNAERDYLMLGGGSPTHSVQGSISVDARGVPVGMPDGVGPDPVVLAMLRAP